MSSISLIQDCQWGSTGKGLFANYLGSQHQPDVLAMAPSPNAGHTFITKENVRIIHRMLPCGIGAPGLRSIVLGPGSLLDLDVLYAEIKFARMMQLIPEQVVIYVHLAAAVVLDRHRQAESDGGTAPGSTRKGTGAAQIDAPEARRTAQPWLDANRSGLRAGTADATAQRLYAELAELGWQAERIESPADEFRLRLTRLP